MFIVIVPVLFLSFGDELEIGFTSSSPFQLWQPAK